jgi:prepilin peptidase CpaA
MDDWTRWAPLMMAALLMVPAVICDLRHRRIPNFLTLGGSVAGLALHGWLGGWGGAGFALLSGLILLASTFGLFALGWLGAGDVKLFAAAGVIGGNLNTALNIVLITAVVGGLLGLLMLLRRRSRKRAGSLTGERTFNGVTEGSRRAQSVPYAVAIAIGTLLAIAYRLA